MDMTPKRRLAGKPLWYRRVVLGTFDYVIATARKPAGGA